MNTTRKTLLERVRDSADAEAWEQFFALYAPLLESYARAMGLPKVDAEEVRDECLALVAKRIASFEYARANGSFKGWLYRIVHGKAVDLLRRPEAERVSTQAMLAIEDRAEGLDERWETLWRREHLRHALDMARCSEDGSTIRVFELLTVEGLGVLEVCARTGLSARQVYKAKARVLRRVRELLRRWDVGT